VTRPTRDSVVHCSSVDHINYVDNDDQRDFFGSSRQLLTSPTSHVTSLLPVDVDDERSYGDNRTAVDSSVVARPEM